MECNGGRPRSSTRAPGRDLRKPQAVVGELGAGPCARRRGTRTREVWDELGDLPHFTPDDDGGAPVASLRAAVTRADGLVIATPEYAGGMPGSLKNALDWLVGTGELYDKHVAVMSAAPSPERGQHARRWVEEVLRIQGGHVVASFTVTHADDPGDVLARIVDAFDH